MSEHWQTGAMSRNMTWLVGLAPSAFVEIGTALAQRKGIKNGDQVIVSSARGSIEVYALVTERFQPFYIDGQMVDEIGLPWHWGYAGLVPGDRVVVVYPNRPWQYFIAFLLLWPLAGWAFNGGAWWFTAAMMFTAATLWSLMEREVRAQLGLGPLPADWRPPPRIGVIRKK